MHLLYVINYNNQFSKLLMYFWNNKYQVDVSVKLTVLTKMTVIYVIVNCTLQKKLCILLILADYCCLIQI